MTTIFLDLETIPDPNIGWTPKTPDEFPPPFACRLVCAGALVVGNGMAAEAHASPMSEDWILSQVFERIADPNTTVVTWNGRGFDLPVLVARGLAHGSEVSEGYLSFVGSEYGNQWRAADLTGVDRPTHWRPMVEWPR